MELERREMAVNFRVMLRWMDACAQVKTPCPAAKIIVSKII